MSRTDVQNYDRYPARPASQVELATPNSVEDREEKVIRANDTENTVPV